MSDGAAPRPHVGWFNELADFLGPAYLRNAFTMGTVQEVDFIVSSLDLRPGMRVLDVGCGPGRHSLELARRGFDCTGVDLSATFIELAKRAADEAGVRATFEVCDVREIEYDSEFDAVICLCQGGFGLLAGDESPALLRRLGRSLKEGGCLALSAFHAYFAVRYLEAGDKFDPATGVNHELATLRDAAGVERQFSLWTTCFTARELELMARGAGLRVDGVFGVTPGDYGERAPTLDRPELLLVAQRQAR